MHPHDPTAPRLAVFDEIQYLDCLRSLTDFGSCNGETLLDTTCAATCRAGGALPFRNSFGPALFSAHDVNCLRETP